MELKLEELPYQREAIDAVVRLFEGQPRNTFDMASREDVRSNVLTIPAEQIRENFLATIKDSGIDEETASLDEALDFCIETETGTGKTLVYLKTAYELYLQYAFTKFLILVPSVAIKEGVLSTFARAMWRPMPNFNATDFKTRPGYSLINEFEVARQATTSPLIGEAIETPVRKRLQQVLTCWCADSGDFTLLVSFAHEMRPWVAMGWRNVSPEDTH